MQAGGKSFRETKGKYCFRTSHYYTAELISSEYHKSQRSKWLKTVIDHFFWAKTWTLTTNGRAFSTCPVSYSFSSKYLLLTTVGYCARLIFGLIPYGSHDQGNISGKKKDVSKLISASLYFFSQDTDNPPRYKQMKKSFLFIF